MAKCYLHFYDPWPGSQISRYYTCLSFECSPTITLEYCAIKLGHNISISILFRFKLDIKVPLHFAIVGVTIGLEQSFTHIERSHCQSAWFAVKWELHIRTGASQLLSERSQRRYRKIPKKSPGAYIFQRPFLRDLFLEGLMYGGKFAFKNRLG